MKFKIGDKVRIKYPSCGVGGVSSTGTWFAESMRKYIGDEFVITGLYHMAGYKGWFWDFEWLELVGDKQIIKLGDRVRSRQIGEEYTGTVVNIYDRYAAVRRDDTGRIWYCKVIDGRIATAHVLWDGESFLELEEKPKVDVSTQLYYSKQYTGVDKYIVSYTPPTQSDTLRVEPTKTVSFAKQQQADKTKGYSKDYKANNYTPF